MIAHLARTLQEEMLTFFRRRNGHSPNQSEIERLAPDEPGTVPTAVKFDTWYMDYTTGRTHTVRVTITETISNDR